MFARLLVFLGCYLLGSIPTAYLLIKWVKGVDIRTVGSGNVGATNALRTAGIGAGVMVLAIDALKGFVAAAWMPRWLLQSTTPTLALTCGLAAVLGHAFPCFLRFQGGKGVATTLGVLLGSSPMVAGIVIGTWLMVFAAFRYVSLGSLVAAVAIPVTQLLFHHALREAAVGAALAGLIIVRHRANIQRLAAGVEHRAWSRKEG